MSWVPISTWIIGILTEIFQDLLQNTETYHMQCHILESSKLMAVSDSFKPFYKLHAINSQNIPNNLYSSISSLFLVNDQRDAQFFNVLIYIFNSLHVSSTSCLSSGETNCANTISGSCQWPCHVQVRSEVPTCTRHGHRQRVTAARGCIDTICLTWWWARCARNI